jgi:hypothetical protein
LANPFAHALMQCLAVAEVVAAPARPVELELERYRTRPIEVDDTSVARIRLEQGPPIVVAVTLCTDRFIAGEIQVRTEGGRALLEYPTDRLQLPGEPSAPPPAGRTDLLENLLAHRAYGTPLVAPLSRTAAFTALAEAILAAPAPHPIDASYHRTSGDGPDRMVAVDGISHLLRRAATTLALPTELGAPWAMPGWRSPLHAPDHGNRREARRPE